MKNEELEKKAIQVRLDTLKAIHKAGSGFVGGNMSVIEILVSLYYGDLGTRKAMLFDATKPGCGEQDYLIMSKGSAAPAQYAVLADLGFFDSEELNYLGQVGSVLKARPSAKVPGVSANVLIDGRGLSVAVGLAMSLKMERKNNRVFTIMEDKELLRGQVWEAATMAYHYKLDNLVAIIDNPRVEVDPTNPNDIKVDDIQHKFESFGWKVIQVRDGHDFDQLLDAYIRAFASVRKPVCIWCHTVAGRGVEFAERKHSYLRANLSHGEMADIVPKLEVQL